MGVLEDVSRTSMDGLNDAPAAASPSQPCSSTKTLYLSRELLVAIAAYSDPPALSRLSRTSKLLYSVGMPLLHKRVNLRTNKAYGAYERTMRSWIAPWVRKQVGEGKIKLWEVDELDLDFDPDEKPAPYWLPDLSFIASANLLNNLTSLTIKRIALPSNLLVSLLAPGRPARSSLSNLRIEHCDSSSFDRPNPSFALAFILKMLEFLPHHFYLIDEEEAYMRDEVEEKRLRRKSSWDKLNKLIHAKPVGCSIDEWLMGYCVPYGEQDDIVDQLASEYDPFPPFADLVLRDDAEYDIRTSSDLGGSHSYGSESEYEDDVADEDDLSLYGVDEEERYLCHRPPLGDRPQPVRRHGPIVRIQLTRLSSTKSTSEAFALFSKLLRLPGRRICNACLSLPSFLVNGEPSTSPFSNLTSLTWTLSFSDSRDEDLLILLGTEIIKGVRELKLVGRIGTLTREMDLLIRTSVASHPSSPPGRLIPPQPLILPGPATRASLNHYFAAPHTPTPPLSPYQPARGRKRPPQPQPYPPQKEEDPHAPKPYKASWIAHLTAAEREGEELVKRYRGPKLEVLDASAVKVGKAGE